jgi:hypothetical protein
MLYGKKPFGEGIPQTTLFASSSMQDEMNNVSFPADSKIAVSPGAKQFIQACLISKQYER